MISRRLPTLALMAGCLTVAFFPVEGRAQLPVGGFSSDNVEWIKNIPLESSRTQTQGNLVGNYFYVHGLETIEIYDVTDPVNPRLLSQIRRPGLLGWLSEVGLPPLVPQGGAETTATNGKILLFAGGRENQPVGTEVAVYVYDVRKKDSPKLVGVAEAPRDVYSSGLVCLLDCSWAYTREGHIIDLRDPRKPQFVDARWNESLDFQNNLSGYRTANLTEISPGAVLAGSVPMYLLDVSPDPKKPRVRATSDGSPMSFGAVAWPDFPKRSLIMSSKLATEFMPPRCEIRDAYRDSTLDSGFKTWSAARWRSTGLITGVDVYRISNGTYTDGDPAFSGAVPPYWGCGANSFDVHPDFRDGGLVAHATHGHGVKFLRIDERGKIKLAGWFLPHGNDTFAAHWITDRIVYTLDVPRGIDILSFTGKT